MEKLTAKIPQYLNFSISQFLLLFFILLLSLLLPSPVFAGPINLEGKLEGLTGFMPNPDNPGETVEKFFSILLGAFTLIGGMMLLVYFVLGALGWITAGGDQERLQKAQNKMTNAIVGLIIVVAAYGVIYVVGLVVGFDILKPATILPSLRP